jgi:hypothetical protein
MQKSLKLSKLYREGSSFKGNSVDFICNECGGTFQKPILATVSCDGRVQTYYACPRCMARISKEYNEITTSKKTVKKTPVKLENNVKCRHFLGYLKKRPKDAPIPDECLTCDKMIECLLS